MWHLGHGLVVSTAVQGEKLDLMTLGGFSNLNNSVIPSLTFSLRYSQQGRALLPVFLTQGKASTSFSVLRETSPGVVRRGHPLSAEGWSGEVAQGRTLLFQLSAVSLAPKAA